MSEIRFSDGIPDRREELPKIIYPEELLDKKCGGCVRCGLRKRQYKGKIGGYHCSMQEYEKDIYPEDPA